MTAGDGSASGNGIDALVPSEIAKKAEQTGAQKIHLDPASLFALAMSFAPSCCRAQAGKHS